MNSNKADLKLLEDMGITPDHSVREKKRSLKTVGWAVVACLRMKNMQEAWAGNQRLQESLVRKLEAMRGRSGKTVRLM